VPEPKLTHKKFQASVESLARTTGWLVYSTWNSKHSPAGFPDEVMVRPPRLIFAELKIPPDRVSAAQMAWLETLAKLDCAEIFVWTPDEFENIVGELER
jgi:hypothetical protein